MTNLPILFFSLLFFGIILYHLFFSKEAKVHGKIKKVKAKKFGEILDNETVRISGKVVYAGRTILAPLSKRKCVYYYVKVEDPANGSERDYSNGIDLEEEHGADIVIYDGEHYALINTALVTSSIVTDQETYSGFWNFSTPELKAFLKKHGERTTNMMGWSLNLVGREGIIEEGELVTVAGVATWRNAAEFRLKISAKKILFINPLNENGVYLTDDPTI